MPPKIYQEQATSQVPPQLQRNHAAIDKDQYQFLHNVHFPEKPPVVRSVAAANPPQNDLSYLLPPGMSFYDIAIESKENQMKWFMRLMETQGLEAANKFTEILRQVPTQTVTPSLPPPKPSVAAPPPTTEQFDLFLDDFMKSPTAAQPLLKDILGYSNPTQPVTSSAIPHVNNGYMTQPAKISSGGNMEAELFGPKPGEQHQSIPLYRRQAGQSYAGAGISTGNAAAPKIHPSSVTSPDLMDQSTLLESIEKLSQNFPATLFNSHFADQNGFVQGLPSIQTLAANLQHQQQQQTFQQQQQHQNHHHDQLRQAAYTAAQQQQMYNAQPQQVEELMRAAQGASAASATYASVLSGAGGMQNKQQSSNSKEGLDSKDPFSSRICSLGKSNGYYNYFQ